VGPRAFLGTVVKRKIPSPYRDSNPRTSNPQSSATPLSYSDIVTLIIFVKLVKLLSLCLAKPRVMETYQLLNLAQCHEDIRKSGGITPCILDLGTTWRCVVSFMPRPLYPRGKSTTIPIGWEAEFVPEPVWKRWRREKIPSLDLLGFERRSSSP
jgi:hypothetical protein